MPGLGDILAQANGCIINICASSERESPVMQRAIQDIPRDRTAFERCALMRTNITECVDTAIDIQHQYLFVVADFYDSSSTCWEFVCSTYADDCSQLSSSGYGYPSLWRCTEEQQGMGVVQYPAQVKLFCGVLVAPAVSQSDVEDVLQRQFGDIILRSQAWPFLQTSYYTREMGGGLTRLYLAFDPLISIPELVAVKHTTNRLEGRWSAGPDQRRVNLDPGYLDLGKVVLATTKNHAHRLYIGAGIYAEVTLRYRQKTFQAWEWTYPDYQLPSALHFFNQLRHIYKGQLRTGPPSRL